MAPLPIYAPVGKNGSTVRSKLNIAYFKNLQNRTNVAYQKKKNYMRIVPTYFWMESSKYVPYLKNTVRRSIKAPNVPYVKGTVGR